MVKIEATTIIDALNKKIAEIFTPEEVVVTYVDTVPQDFKRKSIAILEIDLSGIDGLKNDDREIQDHYAMYDITYIPTKPENVYSEFRNIKHKIDTYLTEINLTDTYTIERLDLPNHNITEGLGHSIITFFYRVAVVDEDPTAKIKEVNTDNTKIIGG